MNKRIEWIDICKGIAIILVIIGHSNLTTGIAFNFKHVIYSFHMPLFFVISGFLFCIKSERQESVLDYFKKRAKSLIIPYIVFNIIYLGIDILKSFITNNHINVVYKLIGIVFPIRTKEYVGKTWFLIWIFFTEIIYKLIISFTKNEKKLNIICILLFYLGFILIKYNIALPYHLDAAFVSIIFYNFGYMLKKKDVKINNKKTIFVLSLIFIITLIINKLFIEYMYGNNVTIDLYEMTLSLPIIYFITSICGSLITIWISQQIKIKSVKEILKKFGYNSLCIYGFHTIIILIIITIFGKFNIPIGREYLEIIRSIIIVFICTLIFPICKICEKYFPLLFGYRKGEKNER